MGLFDGLKKHEFGDLEDKDAKIAEENITIEKKDSKPQKVVEEIDCLFQKGYECPLCGKKFTQPTVKTNYMRIVNQDRDLRPRYQYVDANKYDIIHCNHCGYAALSRYFGPLANGHKKMLNEKIQMSYIPLSEIGETISYEEAKERFQLALDNAIARQAHSSEKALICLRMAWILRGMQEETKLYMEKRIAGLIEMADTVPSLREEVEAKNRELIEVTKRVNLGKIVELKTQEDELLRQTLEGLLSARKEEQPPIGGMNDITLDYLLGVLCTHFERYGEAIKLLQGIILSKTAGRVQKDKAREIVNEIKRKMDMQ